MGSYKSEDWYLKARDEYLEKYGDVPPPWVYAPNTHPYSLGWRMGGGESHLMVLGEWLEEKELDFNERLEYLQKYPPSPRWYQWVVHFLWDIVDTDFPESAYGPYFEKLKGLGFENVSGFSEDFDRDDLE